jgi:hypothetical protein
VIPTRPSDVIQGTWKGKDAATVTKQLEKNPRDKRMSAMRNGGVLGRRHAFRETQNMNPFPYV